MAQEREIVTADPFAVLGVAEDAGDEAIKRRYLTLVRRFPPDREPERFQAYRRAYERIRGARERAQLRLLQSTDAALSRLKRHLLQTDRAVTGHIPEAAVATLIADGLKQVTRD
jgi:hypothetical protein